MAKRNVPHHDPVGRIPVDVVRFRKALGRVIAEVRQGLDLSQEEFAAKLGLDQTTVAKAETGIHLWRLETWLNVSRALRIPFYELFRRAAERDPSGRNAMDRVVEALEPKDEVRLILIWRQLTRPGRDVLMERAEACLSLHRQDDNVVALVHQAKRERK